jgi:hypothetical protein
MKLSLSPRARGWLRGLVLGDLRRLAPAVIAASLMLQVAAPATAQTRPSGDVTAQPDVFPSRDNTAEIRGRFFVEDVIAPAPKLVFTMSGFAEGLFARRAMAGNADNRTVHDGILRVVDANVDVKTKHVDLLAGFARVSWGRLDELQPTDVINPLDASRFFFESRSEARLPVGLVRLRGYFSDNASIEGVYVPFFRRGVFDQLDEPTSPFNIAPDFSSDLAACLAIGCPVVLPVVTTRREPPATLGNGQGGVRFNATSGTFDWSVSGYRGFETFGLGAIGAIAPGAAFLPVDIVYPRFTMIGGDFETVRGEWGVRGEVAAFVDDNFQGPLRVVKGASIDAGVGVDRRAGAYRVSGTAIFHREAYDVPIPEADGTLERRSNLSLILAADRTFGRERYRVRTFAVYTPDESTAFLRAITIWKLQDNLALEGSGGWFMGQGPDLVGRFSNSDFLYARLKYYF